MRNALSSGLYQALTVKCIAAALGIMSMIFLSSSDILIQHLQQQGLLPVGFVHTFFYSALSEDAVASFLPVLSVLPFAGTYVEDQKSKFTRFFLIRCSYMDYSLSRILVAFLCGGGAVALGALAAWGGAVLFFLPKQLAGEQDLEIVTQILEKLLLLFCNGGLWSVLGMTMSTLMESKYIAYASPFIAYYLLVILCERYFPKAFLLYPPNWMDPEPWPYGVWGVAIFLLELTLIFGILFVRRVERRLREL